MNTKRSYWRPKTPPRSSQLIVDLFEQASFLLDGNFVASVCGAFGVFYFFVAAASVYIMHSSAFTL